MMKKLELTPSRNLNYRQGQAHMGDRYVSVRSEKQFELANHLLTSVVFFFNLKFFFL